MNSHVDNYIFWLLLLLLLLLLLMLMMLLFYFSSYSCHDILSQIIKLNKSETEKRKEVIMCIFHKFVKIGINTSDRTLLHVSI